MNFEPSYYEILGLPETFQDEPNISAQTLRSAYRRALLKHHPDKSQLSAESTLKSSEAVYSIDQISQAYSTLSESKLRTKYDKEYKLKNTITNETQQGRQVFRTGVEVVDLDDLTVDDKEGIWFRSCRCGDGRGFLLREKDLEGAAEDGELSVGCRGCSLWLKVLFGVVEDGELDEALKDEEKDH